MQRLPLNRSAVALGPLGALFPLRTDPSRMQSTHPRYRLPVLTVPRVVEIRDILKEEGKNRTEDECALLHKLLRANKFFVELSHEVREELTRLMGVTTLNANTVLFREGDTSNAFFLLLHGALAIYQHNPPPLSPQERRDSLNEAVAAAEIYALPPSSPSQPALVHALTAPQEVLALPEETSSPHKGGRVSHMMSILDADSPQSQKAAAKKSKTSPIFLTTGTAVKFHMDEVEDEESDDELPPEEEENLGELIATLTPGDTLGELGLVKDTERLVSVKTVLGEGAGEEVRRRFGGERLGVPSKAEQRFDKRQTVVCWIQKEDFLEAFRRAAYKQIEQKMTFLYRWLPDEQVLDEKTMEKLAASFFKPISVPRGHVLLQAGSLQSANEGQRRIYFVYKGECVLRSWGRPMQPVIKKRDLESPRELSCGTLACGHMCGFSSTLLGVVEPFTVVAASSTVDLLAITSHDILSRLPKEVQNGLKRKAETLLRAYLRRQLHNKVAAARLRQLQKMQQQATAPSLFDSPFLKYKQRGFYSKASAARLQQLHQLATGWTPPEIVLEAAPPPSRPSTTAGVSGPPIAGVSYPQRSHADAALAIHPRSVGAVKAAHDHPGTRCHGER
ncbi:unnamed protein product [Vitrella brassicaformis CCMP3155]|uniref:Cyclic nucleotide-binding domain-containing protein n=2 Tax=Vitrella brassicaformis TaxID=1169539 RepID=A0A0G4EUR5_VITBC|nr:unnamed protein product [Vitrella brassicaformis CCMP3155]|eukprot:CEM02194.1 unnamed protein product [Vitrella brassicaformis CCMP3155]